MGEMGFQGSFSGAQSNKVVETALDYIKINHMNCHVLAYPSLIHPFNKISPYLLCVAEKIKQKGYVSCLLRLRKYK